MFLNISSYQSKLLDYMFLKSIVDETNKITVKAEDLITTLYKNSTNKEIKELFNSIYSLSFWHEIEQRGQLFKIFDSIEYECSAGIYTIVFNKQIYKFATNDDLYWLFSHKYVQRLYKTLKEQYVKLNKGYTASVDIAELRIFLLNDRNKYPAPKDFIKNIVNTAVSEINKYSNLYVKCVPVCIDNKKPGRNGFSQVKFTVSTSDADVLFENNNSTFELSSVPGQITIDEYIESIKNQVKKRNEDLFIGQINNATKGLSSLEKANYIRRLLSSLS